MSVKTKILAGAAGLAALVGFAAPAAAQYYPGYGYGNNNVVGQIIGQVLGYGQYPYGNYGYNQYGNQRMAVDQCARAVEARIGGNRGGYYGYGNVPYGGGYGYNQGYGGVYGYNQGYGGGYGYNQGYGGGRVLGITRVERKSYGLKVRGVASSGYNGYDGYGRRGYGNYGYNAGADLSWSCEVRYDGRIRDIDVNRRSANWRGY
ncbi:MAG TPA: hypothetical protein VFO45_04230 [Sphingomicrobium sp.]|nr:hypothetical protein [Sphingomicrobium sp.]